jgi:hypothetical protein
VVARLLEEIGSDSGLCRVLRRHGRGNP